MSLPKVPERISRLQRLDDRAACIGDRQEGGFEWIGDIAAHALRGLAIGHCLFRGQLPPEGSGVVPRLAGDKRKAR